MSNVETRPQLFLFLILLFFSLLLAFFFLLLSQIPEFTIQDHSFRLPILSLLKLSLLLLVILLALWILYSKIISILFSLKYSTALSQDFLTYLPVLFLILSPLAASHYLISDDLLFRLKLFGLAVLLSLLYLKIARLYILGKEHPSFFNNWAKKFPSLSLKKKLILLFVGSLILYSAGSSMLVTNGIFFSGDEPHYLLISHSLLEDGDFNLSNNYSNRDYSRYMPSRVKIGPHLAPGTKGQYSFHSPGTSLLLLPFYALGSFFEKKFMIIIIRFGMSIFGSLFGLQIFLYALQEWKRENLALTLWFIFSFTSPVFFYSIHVYPEIIVALFSFTIFRLLRFSKSFSKPTLLAIGFFISSFIWLHTVKYIFILIPLFIYTLWILIKKHKIGWNLFYFLFFPFVLTSLHLLFSYNFYNSLSPFSVSLKGPATTGETITYLRQLITDIPFRYRWETLAGYFFDQKDGLLFYSPVYFFCFLGMVEMGRRKLRELILVLLLTAPYVLNLAFLTQRTAYAPQARTLVAVCWGLGIFIGYFLAYNAKKIFSYALFLTSFLSFLFVYLLLKNPLAIYQLTTAGETERAGKLFLHLSNLHFFLPRYLPSYLKIEDSLWLPNLVWIGLLFLFIASYLVIKKHSFSTRFSYHLLFSFLGILVFFIWIVLYPRTVLLYPTKTPFPSGEKITFYSLGRVAQMKEPGKFYLPKDKRPYIFHFTSWREVKEFQIEFGSLEGEYFVEIKFFDQELFKGKTVKEIRTLSLPSPLRYRLKNTNLYRISIYLERKSEGSTRKHPYFFSITPLS